MTRTPARPLLTAVWVVAAAAVLLAAVFAAQWVMDAAPGFFADYPGYTALPAGAPAGFPVWLSIQHGVNATLLLLIVLSGWTIHQKKRPPAVVTVKGARLSIHAWWHLAVDTLWTANGLVFVVLLLSTGQWMRIVPTSWAVFPNAVSAGIQYLALRWPAQDGWDNYNSLQVLGYFVTVFVAAPLAILTGLRLSPVWKWRQPSEGITRQVHFAVLVYLALFTVAHVTLVLATGALQNLNAMYAGRHDASWIGLAVFLASVIATVIVWRVFRVPTQLRIARRTGDVREFR